MTQQLETFYPSRLTYLRFINNMTETELARLCECSKQAISHYEKGKRIPKGSILLMLCQIFKVSQQFFYEYKFDITVLGNKFLVNAKPGKVTGETPIQEEETDSLILSFFKKVRPYDRRKFYFKYCGLESDDNVLTHANERLILLSLMNRGFKDAINTAINNPVSVEENELDERHGFVAGANYALSLSSPVEKQEWVSVEEYHQLKEAFEELLGGYVFQFYNADESLKVNTRELWLIKAGLKEQ